MSKLIDILTNLGFKIETNYNKNKTLKKEIVYDKD